MDSNTNISQEDPVQQSLIFKRGKWTQPPPTSTDTDSATQEFTVRYVQLY